MTPLETTLSGHPSVGPEPLARANFSLEEVLIGIDEKIQPGALLFDRYEILSVLGQGGIGTVYLAEHVELGRKIAIKILSEEWSTNSFVVRRFRAEARIAASIGHPNIIKMFDVGVFSDGRMFQVMEYIEGVDLKQEILAQRTREPLRACQIMLQIGLALAAVHALGVIHRDLKPGNIMLVPEPGGGELVKVLDFGIAANTAARGLHGERLTRSGLVMGTPEYMAPEQAIGDMPSPAFDIYAMGVILYEMLIGTLPLTAEHSFELLAFKRHYPAPSLQERAPNLPGSLIALVDECLQIDPDLRPPDVTAVVGRLKAVIAEVQGESVPDGLALPPSIPTPVSDRGGVPWLKLGLVGFGALALSVALLGGSNLPLTESARTEDLGPPSPQPSDRSLASVIDPAARDAPPRAPPPTTTTDPDKDPSEILAAKSKPAKDKPVVAARTSQAHATERCVRTRKAAGEARQTHSWAMLRNHSRNYNCWEDPGEPRKLQVKAMLELGDYEGCVSVGAGRKDPDVAAWVKLCRIRGGL